jgi:NitT/TauT family transport system ATP-binding protein
MASVSFKTVTKEYALKIGRQMQTVRALRGVDLEVGAGQIAALVGPSGCGKTTALRIAMGLERPTTGSVVVDGKTIEGCGYDRGLVFQHAELLPWQTALQNVMFGLEMKGVRQPELKDRAMAQLELVGLAHCWNRRPHQLSGGMKQRVGIARALAIDPKVLLMEEPFGALDPQTREELQAELLRIQAKTGKTVIIVTHDLDEAVLLAGRIVVMRDGVARETIDLAHGEELDIEARRNAPDFVAIRTHLWRALQTPAETACAPTKEIA